MSILSTLYFTLMLLAAGVTVALVALRLTIETAERRQQQAAVWRQRYLRIIVTSYRTDPAASPRLLQRYRATAPMRIAEVVTLLRRTAYDFDEVYLRRIVVDNDLEGHLLRRIRYSRALRRARYLKILAALPLDAESARRVERYRRNRHRAVRFAALEVQLAAEPTRALELIRRYRDTLTGYEVAEIILSLRRGNLSIACEPMLNAPIRNLRRLGLALVRQFALEEMAPSLRQLVEQREHPATALEALYTLVSLHAPLRNEATRPLMALLDPLERQSLMRHIAREGYPATTLQQLFNRDEQPYAEAIVQSYKRTLR